MKYVGVRRQSVMLFTLFVCLFICLFFVCHSQPIIGAGHVLASIQQEIASVFVDQFRCGLQRFFEEETLFQASGTLDGTQMPEKNFKI